MPEDWPPVLLWGLIQEAIQKSGRKAPKDSGEAFMNMLREGGFTDVQSTVTKCPTGVWPKGERLKQAGRFTLMSIETAYEAYALALCTRMLGMPEEEVLDLCDRAREAHMNPGVHAYWE